MMVKILIWRIYLLQFCVLTIVFFRVVCLTLYIGDRENKEIYLKIQKRMCARGGGIKPKILIINLNPIQLMSKGWLFLTTLCAFVIIKFAKAHCVTRNHVICWKTGKIFSGQNLNWSFWCVYLSFLSSNVYDPVPFVCDFTHTFLSLILYNESNTKFYSDRICVWVFLEINHNIFEAT